VIIDERGVTRHGLFRTHTLGWPEIRDYRLRIDLAGEPMPLRGMIDTGWTDFVPAVDVAAVASGRRRIRLAVELIGGSGRSVAFGALRFRGANEAIPQILERLAPRLEAEARAELAARRRVTFGPLELSSEGVRWRARKQLTRERVETIELFDSYPVRLRVMERHKVLSFGSVVTANVPRLHVALALAEELGYRVRGRKLMAALAGPVASNIPA
jgi:hypothetical protein